MVLDLQFFASYHDTLPTGLQAKAVQDCFRLAPKEDRKRPKFKNFMAVRLKNQETSVAQFLLPNSLGCVILCQRSE